MDVNMEDSYDKFLNNYKKTKTMFDEKQESIFNINLECGYVWLSCLPWFKFTGCIPPYDKNITIPQLIWDKFEIENNHVYINLLIIAHHGFVDGYHIAELII